MQKIHFKDFLLWTEIKAEGNGYQFLGLQASLQLLKKSCVVNLLLLKLYDADNSFLEQINQKHEFTHPVNLKVPFFEEMWYSYR